MKIARLFFRILAAMPRLLAGPAEIKNADVSSASAKLEAALTALEGLSRTFAIRGKF